jgi:hypothetical protein
MIFHDVMQWRPADQAETVSCAQIDREGARQRATRWVPPGRVIPELRCGRQALRTST